MGDHGRETDHDGFGELEHLVEQGCRALIAVLGLAGVEVGDVRVGFGCHGLALGNSFDAALVAKDIRAAAGEVLDELVCGFAEVADDEELAG